jgi:hypothetical protein
MKRRYVLCLAALIAMITVAALAPKKESKLLVLEWAAKSSLETPPVAVLIEMGLTDKDPTSWSNQATITGAKVVHREGYRFRKGDKLVGKDGWETSSHRGLRVPPRSPQISKLEPIATVGVVLHLADVTDDATLTLNPKEPDGKKAVVALKDVLAGKTQLLWDGAAAVRLVSTATPLAVGKTEDDFPAAAYGPDGTLWVAYISYTLKDESRRIEQHALEAQPEDFKKFYAPEFGDQLFVKYFRDGKWSKPIAITGAKEDLVRCAVAVEGDGTARVIYSANRNGRHDIYARAFLPKKNEEPPFELQAEQRWTGREHGPNIGPVACTDKDGTVWVSCQNRSEKGAHQILWFPCPSDRKVEGDVNPGYRTIRSNMGFCWGVSIAAGPRDFIDVAYDSYKEGDYDVSLDQPGTRTLVASSRFEARPSICYDPKGRLWIAYEEGPEKWGKDSGALVIKGNPLYSARSVRVVCLQDGKLMRPAAELPTSDVKNPGAQIDALTVHRQETGTRYSYPKIGIDGKGRVWVTYRQNFGSRYSTHAGSSWQSFARRLDGDKWSEPIEIHHSDGLLDSRPVLLPHKSGGLLVIHNTDGRYIEPETLHNHVYMSYVNLPGDPVEPKLVPHDPGKKDDKLVKEAEEERAAVKCIREYRLEAGGKKYQLLRGEFHRHTELSWDGGADGSLEDMFRYAIDAAALDWISNDDHDNGAGREYSWWLIQKFTDAYHVKNAFTPMHGYERSVSYPHGHRNCLFAKRGVRTLPRLAEMDEKKRVAGIHADDTKMLYRYLKEMDGICSSHTSATGMGTDWRDHDDKLEPVVEIYQGDRNSYEKEEAPRAGHDPKSGKKPVNIAGWFPKGYINNALAKGYRLGFESSSDHWSTHISYSVVLAEKHDRESILDAFRKRHCYAATDNIIVDVRSGEHIMGDELKTSAAPALDIHVIGTNTLARIHILKDSEVVKTIEPDKHEYKGKWTDPKPTAEVHYYYIRVEQADGELAWASPMWIDYAP